MLYDSKTIEHLQGRTFLPKNFNADSWDEIAPYFEDLKYRTIKSVEVFHKWLHDRSEIEAALQEDLGWRYCERRIFKII